MNPANPLKVSVLSSGEILLEGRRVALTELERVLQQGAKEDAVVWYYRENAAGEPPQVVAEVMKMIVGHRLPIRLSSRPDFSDTVTPALSDLDQLFRLVREQAALGQLVILRSDGRRLLLPAAKKGASTPEAVASVESLLPSRNKRNVAVIGDTAWAMDAAPDLRSASQAIPFLGLLIGFSTIGHAVWIFEGKDAAVLAAGCRDADVLIVDGQCLAGLPPQWQSSAVRAMRNPQVLVHDRATFQLRRLDLSPARDQ